MKFRFGKIKVLLATLLAFGLTSFMVPQASLAACSDGQATLISKTVTYQGDTPTFHFKFKTHQYDTKIFKQAKNNSIRVVVSDKSKQKVYQQGQYKKTVNKKLVPLAKPAPKPVPQPVTQEAAKPVSQSAANTTQPTAQVGNFQQQVVDLVNQERAKHGLSPLTMKQDLTNVAQIKAQDMLANQYFSHISPTYGSPFDLMKKNGISFLSAGENIAMGQQTPAQVVQDWMNSPGHRANILNPDFNEIGVGVANSYNGNGFIWVQAFSKR